MVEEPTDSAAAIVASPPLARMPQALWMVGPSFAGLLLLLVVGFIIHPSFDSIGHLGTLVVLASFVMVVGFGQGLTILTGGLDLSIPYTLTFAAVALSLVAQSGSHGSLLFPALGILGACVLIGIINGLGIELLSLSPIVMTLATNTILNGVVLVITSGSPGGASPQFLSSLMNQQFLGHIPVLLPPLAAFVAAAILLLEKTTFGRAVYAVGNSRSVAHLSGVAVRRTTVAVYAISALCAGLGGFMLLGFANQSFIGMGDPYLLPSIAAVVIGGASALGGRGKYIGTVGGALLLEALSAILGTVFQSVAVQDMLYGLVILLAMLAVRA